MNIVKELRKRADLQQQELAAMVGVARPTVSEWETQKKDPSGERLKKLAEIFEVDPLVILGKGVFNISKSGSTVDLDGNVTPRTEEARTLAIGVDRMSQEDRDRVLRIVRMMFEHTDYFDT